MLPFEYQHFTGLGGSFLRSVSSAPPSVELGSMFLHGKKKVQITSTERVELKQHIFTSAQQLQHFPPKKIPNHPNNFIIRLRHNELITCSYDKHKWRGNLTYLKFSLQQRRRLIRRRKKRILDPWMRRRRKNVFVKKCLGISLESFRRAEGSGGEAPSTRRSSWWMNGGKRKTEGGKRSGGLFCPCSDVWQRDHSAGFILHTHNISHCLPGCTKSEILKCNIYSFIPTQHWAVNHRLQAATLGCNTGLQHWAATLGCNTGLQHWAATLCCNTGLQHWAATLGCNTELPPALFFNLCFLC